MYDRVIILNITVCGAIVAACTAVDLLQLYRGTTNLYLEPKRCTQIYNGAVGAQLEFYMFYMYM